MCLHLGSGSAEGHMWNSVHLCRTQSASKQNCGGCSITRAGGDDKWELQNCPRPKHLDTDNVCSTDDFFSPPNFRSAHVLFLSPFNFQTSMALPIRTRPSFPFSQSLPSGSFHKPLILLHQRTHTMKTTVTKKLTNLNTLTTALSNSVKL